MSSFKIDSIDLLSIEDFNKYKIFIPDLYKTWWLKSPGSGANALYVVTYLGDAVSDGYNFDHYLGVRPVLTLVLDTNDPRFWYSKETLAGTKIRLGNGEWTILNIESGRLFIISDKCIASRMQFDNEANVWDDSKLKKWLETEGLNLIY